MFAVSLKTYYFAFILLANCWLEMVELAEAQGAAGYCGITEDVKPEVADIVKNCMKTLNVVGEENLKDFETKYDDKGLTLCALQKLSLATDDGTIDKEKLIKYLKNDDAGFAKAIDSCMAKSDSELKGESDASTKAKKKVAFFMVCMDKDFCKGKKP